MFGIKNPFKKEKKAELPKEIENPLTQIPEAQKTETKEEKKPELEVLIAKIDALKFQYEALNEKISNIEKMLKEIYEMAKSS